MALVGRYVFALARVATACVLVCAAIAPLDAAAQDSATARAAGPPMGRPGNGAPPNSVPLPPPIDPVPVAQPRVVDIRLQGNRRIGREKVLSNMGTRIDRPFDQATFEKDVRKLTARNWFVHVVPKKEFVPGGVIITLNVVERPVLEYVRYHGAENVGLKKIEKETGLKKGDPFDPFAVQEAARKIESLYQSKGYNDVKVDIAEGSKHTDRGAVFVIREGKLVKFSEVVFRGNDPTIAPDGRLKGIVESRKPILFFFKGKVDKKVIEEDVDKLTDYYRSLGFFMATVGRSYEYNADENKMRLVFQIHEGQRYKIRSVSFIGNRVYPEGVFVDNFKLTGGNYYDLAKMNSDIGVIKDLYGSNGYVFADAVGDVRFLEAPGELDLIYRITEGEQYRVGDINITIKGDNPHTRYSTVLNRMSMRPGDIANIKDFRSTERRLKSSGLFEVDPSKGELPRVVFSPPDAETQVAREQNERPKQRPTGNPDTFRGQSEDPPARPLPARQPQVVSNTAPPQRPAPSTNGVQHAAYTTPAPATNLAPRQRTAARQPGDEPGSIIPQAGRDTNIRMQSPAPNNAGYGGSAVNPIAPGGSNYAVNQPAAGTGGIPASGISVAQGPGGPSLGGVPQDFGGPPPLPAPNGNFLGAPEVLPPPAPQLPIDIVVNEAQTGRFMLGAGVNSNAGLVGSVILDERNFDWQRWPTSWEDFRSGRAFRGAGQTFRIEAAPGTQVQRYLFNFAEPYMFDTPVSFGLSGYYFNRFYQDWAEQRLGGRVNLGYQFTPDLSGTIGFRGEDVLIDPNNNVPLVPELAAAQGHSQLYGFSGALAHDTRDSTFLPTEGHYIVANFEYVEGTFQYPKFFLNSQKHWLLRQRPDGTGRHTFSYYNQLGFAGPDTPIYERFYAGGFSTLRGFQFRGASPVDQGVQIGGDFQYLNTLEYMFPVTADDMFKMVAFVDFGTVEETININWSNFRIAPGLGFRVTIPMISPAPIAVDFAVPIHRADGDQLQLVSFFVGVGR